VIVVSVYPQRIEEYGHLWGDFTVWRPSVDGIREAYAELAAFAVAEGWDQTVQVQQDDVVVEWAKHKGSITSYQMHKPYRPRRLNPVYHTCPRAFTATPAGWKKLAEAWDQEGKTCELWLPDHWYDLTTHHPDIV
jgi:hypothetical protein